ncbi:MAG TPA: ABC transporter permease [Silvibacterium sp.]|nr:ABC transporter permease [Silvibacterium sp.]
MVLYNLRHAFRQLVRLPGFTITAILTLALGIGANTAIFSVVNAVLRHPAGVDHPERVAVMNVFYRQLALDVPFISVPDYADTASLHNVVEAGAMEKAIGFNTAHDGKVEHVSGAQVGWQWFQVFGVHPIFGRTFTAEEDQANAGLVAVISYGLWQRVFGGSHDVVGKTLLLDDKSYRVIGVMRSDFDWPRRNEVWVPIALGPKDFAPNQRYNENYQTFIRLRPGATVAQVNAGIAGKVREQIRSEGEQSFGKSSDWSFYASQLTQYAAGPLRKPLYVLFGVVGLVLLIASANVAGLFLARTAARTREFAIRTALGANASAIVGQLLAETVLLAGTATLIGIAAGPIFGRLLLWLIPRSLAEGYEVHMDPAVLAFTACAGLLTSLIAGVGPSLRLMRQHQSLDLHEGGRNATASVDKQRLRSVFVIGEVALACLLLTGTGLFLFSLRALQQIDPGFNPHGVLAASVFYSGNDFKKDQPRQAAFIQSVIDNLSAQPGVHAAAAVDPLPFDPTNGGSSSFGIVGRPTPPNDPGPHSNQGNATPDYLKVMQIPLLAGRWISTEDRANTEPVVVIDSRLAHKFWPNQNPVGQHISDGKPTLIIGVVATVRNNSLETDTSDGMRYYAFAQSSDARADFLIRADGDPSAFASTMRRAVAAADSTQAVFEVQPLQALVSGSLAGRRLIVDMLAAFAGLALLLAVVGIYGLISYVTTQRTVEMGVRMAVGAQRSDVIFLVLRSAFVWVFSGLTIGAVLSVVANRLLRQSFAVFGSGAAESLALSVVSLLLVGLFAAFLPALRAASIEPVQALRNE